MVASAVRAGRRRTIMLVVFIVFGLMGSTRQVLLPDRDGARAPGGRLAVAADISTFVAPQTFAATCAVTGGTSTVNGVAGGNVAPAPGPVSGAAAALGIVAIGILPNTMTCTISSTPARIAPGVFELSMLTAGLQNGSGVPATNLRIGCDTLPPQVTGATTDPNTCQGVSFRVIPFGVGIAEIRYRYQATGFASAAGIGEREGAFSVAFLLGSINVNVLLDANPGIAGGTTRVQARFNRTPDCIAFAGNFGAPVCYDPNTGLPQFFNLGASPNGTVVFTIDNSLVARFTTDVTQDPADAPQTAGFLGSPNQTVRRCGLFPTATRSAGSLPSTTGSPSFPTAPLTNFFGGCDSVVVTLRNENPGVAVVTATFVPDLPGGSGSAAAFGSTVSIGTSTQASQNLAALLGLGQGAINPSGRATLQVLAAPLSNTLTLTRGCTNLSPAADEPAGQFAARITPATALVAMWEHQAVTNSFRAYSPQPGAPNNLVELTRLRPVFVCMEREGNVRL